MEKLNKAEQMKEKEEKEKEEKKKAEEEKERLKKEERRRKEEEREPKPLEEGSERRGKDRKDKSAAERAEADGSEGKPESGKEGGRGRPMKEVSRGSGGESERERYIIPRIEPAAAASSRHPAQSIAHQMDEDTIILAPSTNDHFVAFGVLQMAGLIVRAPRGSQATAADHFRFRSGSRQKDTRERS